MDKQEAGSEKQLLFSISIIKAVIYPSFYSIKQTGYFYFGNTKGLKFFSLNWNIHHMTN